MVNEDTPGMPAFPVGTVEEPRLQPAGAVEVDVRPPEIVYTGVATPDSLSKYWNNLIANNPGTTFPGMHILAQLSEESIPATIKNGRVSFAVIAPQLNSYAKEVKTTKLLGLDIDGASAGPDFMDAFNKKFKSTFGGGAGNMKVLVEFSSIPMVGGGVRGNRDIKIKSVKFF